MSMIGTIQVPAFNSHDALTDFMDTHQDKLYLHFLQDNGKIEQNIILSHTDAENVEGREIDTFHCMSCFTLVESLDCRCPECHADDEGEEGW